MGTLLSEIELFISTHGITERKFGEDALNDKNFVRQLRGENGNRPRRLYPETESKVRRFMATYRPDATQDAA